MVKSMNNEYLINKLTTYFEFDFQIINLILDRLRKYYFKLVEFIKLLY